MKIICAAVLLFTIIGLSHGHSQNDSSGSWVVIFESTLGERYWTGNGWTVIKSHAKQYKLSQIPSVLSSSKSNIFDPREKFQAAGADVGAINEIDCVNLVTRKLVAPCNAAY